MSWFEAAFARGLLPDWLLRLGIRRRLAARLRHERRGGLEASHERFREFLAELRRSTVAVDTDAANAQHYEVPAAFFALVLGKHLKYSCALWPAGVTTLDEAEATMLRVTCERADLRDGQQILELGCGWGSLTVWMAQHYPRARITAVSNSASQHAFIAAQCAGAGLTNVTVVTADVNRFAPTQRFDRVVSVEMFEHVRNYEELMRRIASWLDADGRLFVHIFTHRDCAYAFGLDDWIGRHFFTGGTQPSDGLLLHFARDLQILDHWQVSGRHYQRTAEAWLVRHDQNARRIRAVLAPVYGDDVDLWAARWRLFWLACAEYWGYRSGEEWHVSHYLFGPRDRSQ